jgi:F0F1-type ATP synthase assembly protein I
MEEKVRKSNSKFARFSSLGIQMGASIALCTWLGTWLDKKFPNDHSYWTLGLTLFGVIAGFYLVIRDVIKMSKEDDKG